MKGFQARLAELDLPRIRSSEIYTETRHQQTCCFIPTWATAEYDGMSTSGSLMEQGAGGWTEPEEQPFTTVSAAYVEPDLRKKSPEEQMYEEQLAACQGTNAPPREITVRERPFSLSPPDVKEWRKHEAAVLRAIVDETRIEPNILNLMMISFEENGLRLATALINTKPATEREKYLIKSQEHLEVLERQRLHWLQLQLAGLKHLTEQRAATLQLPRLYALRGAWNGTRAMHRGWRSTISSRGHTV